ncbi:MAG: metallophosphoesterase [Candidatus Tokpelaia sp.]|nr:MAG: metallophosphoesterase [Candidatus Tokpelaia sp.]KAA6207084.1 MAG: metallophosphoesterase [Candidatus Tokpelaia sp.]
MYNFIHISDLHLAPLPPARWWQLLNKRLIGYANWQLKRKASVPTGAFEAILQHIRRQTYQHLAISGDLVNLALPAEFDRARAKIASFGAMQDISLVFGNHDAYVPGALALACTVFAPWIKSDSLVTRAAFPYMHIRGEIAFIGVSSAIATPPFIAAGYFSASQARALSLLLQQAAEQRLFRVVMIHHPPYYGATKGSRALWGIKRFQKTVAAAGAELIIHGHTHLPSLVYIQGKAGSNGRQKRVPVVGAAAAAQKFGGHKPPAGYNLFSIGKNRRGEWHCRLRRFSLKNAENAIGCVVDVDLLD